MADSPLIVKICGITSVADGLAALAAGADWLGFVRWPKSKRFVEHEKAAELVRELRAQATAPFAAIGVYVDADRGTIEDDIAALGLDRIQLHGNESADFARALPLPALKAIRVRDRTLAAVLAADYPDIDLLADAFDPSLPGGAGMPYDYGILSELTRKRRVIVAGGLHPGNVGDMVELLRPWGVDVSSGVESAPGRKDPARIRAFIDAARRAAAARS